LIIIGAINTILFIVINYKMSIRDFQQTLTLTTKNPSILRCLDIPDTEA